MIQAKGIAAFSAHEALGPFQFDRRDPKDHDVVIDIHFCGICHSDIHTVRSEWGQARYPVVPGHEIAGVVRAIGTKVTKYQVGDHVGVGCFVDSCRECDFCKDDLDNYCKEMNGTYNSFEKDKKTPTQGGYSDVIVVDENYVLKIPKSLPLDRSAPLLCAGITLYSPLSHWKAGPGKRVGIVGLGGLGHVGVKIARAMGAHVVVLSHSEKKREDALRMGAHEFISTKEENAFQKHANTFDLIVNTVSSADINIGNYLGLLKLDSTLVSVGAPDKPMTVHPFPLIMGRRSWAGSLIGSIKETQEMLDFCAKHEILPEIELISPNDVNAAYERILKSDVRYRFVIDTRKI